MSQRYEVDYADTPLEIITPETDPDDHAIEMEDGSYALVIGNSWASAYAIVGTPQDLRKFVARVSGLVERELPTAAAAAAADELAPPRSHALGSGSQ